MSLDDQVGDWQCGLVLAIMCLRRIYNPPQDTYMDRRVFAVVRLTIRSGCAQPKHFQT